MTPVTVLGICSTKNVAVEVLFPTLQHLHPVLTERMMGDKRLTLVRKLGTAFRCGLSGLSRGRMITPLHLLAGLWEYCPGYCCAGAHSGLPFSLLPTKTPKVHREQNCLEACSLHSCKVLFLLKGTTLHMSVLNFIRFLLACSSRTSRSLWVTALPSSTLTDPPS